jgi:hypothetical protein
MILRAGVLALFTLCVTACGGGSSGGGLPYQPPQSGSIMTSTTASVALPSLSLSGYTVTGSLPPASVAAAIKEALSISAPSGVTPLSKRRVTSRTQGAIVGTASSLLYITLSSDTTVTLTMTPSLTFTAAPIVSGTAYSLGLYSEGAWSAPVALATGGDGTVTFASANTAVTIGPSSPATFVLYTGDATTTAIALLPLSLNFDSGNPTTASFAASEIDYAGAFSATMTCTENPAGQSPGANAFVAQFTGGGTTSSQTPSSAGGSVAFSVDSGAETGTCSVAVSDTNGNSSTETIDVSSSSLTVTGKQRN